MPKYKYVLLLLAFVACTPSPKEVQDVKYENNLLNKKGVRVQAQAVKKWTFQKQIISNGLIQAGQKSELRFKSSERIKEVLVKNGQYVEEGSPLAILDSELLNLQHQKAEIDLQHAQTKLRTEKALRDLENIPDEKINPKVLGNLYLNSGYLEAKNQLEHIQLQVEQSILKAPFAGLVANIEARVGDHIGSADIFCTIIGIQQMQVVFYLMEHELPFISYGQKIKIQSFVDDSQRYTGSITEINPLVDKNGLIQIKAQINTRGQVLFEGMHTRVVIEQSRKNTLAIPKSAIVMRSNKEVVFTLENGLAKWNDVQVIDENSYSYAIEEGVNIGDTLIVSGNLNLSHDAKVEVTQIVEENTWSNTW